MSAREFPGCVRWLDIVEMSQNIEAVRANPDRALADQTTYGLVLDDENHQSVLVTTTRCHNADAAADKGFSDEIVVIPRGVIRGIWRFGRGKKVG